MFNNSSLVNKYNVAGPRYTSYPTVPYWEDNLTKKDWQQYVNNTFWDTNSQDEGISLYIHLPFCEKLCTYCGCNKHITVNHSVEEPYIEYVLKEWQMYADILGVKPRIRELHLGGGTPTFFSDENLKKLINGIMSKATPATTTEFSFEAHPANTTFHHLLTLYRLGFRRLSLGIQDFDTKVQKAINRVQTPEQIEEVTLSARLMGYKSVNYDLIYGLPFQTLESISDTIKKTIALKPDRIAFYSYAHVPWLKNGQRGFDENDLPKDELKRNLYEQGKKMLLEAGYVEIGMDHFALTTDALYTAMANKTLHRNFMGYTPAHTELMIGLGVSSISDAWGAFAQNVKTIKEYYELIDMGEMPVMRGHVLTAEDLILRKHILNLMCNFETDWEGDKGYTGQLDEAIPKLKEMQEDGLVETDNNSIKVTEKGIPFVRNVCMALDARLMRKAPQTSLFSSTV